MASDYGAGVYSPLATVGPDDHGGYVLVAAYILLSLEVMAVVTRLTIRLVRLDDGFIFAALVFAVANVACVHRAVIFGLGRHLTGHGDRDVELCQKYLYTGRIFVVLSIGSAKMALGLLIDMILRPIPHYKIMSRITIAAIAAWCIGTALAFAFECPLPQPWSLTTGGCINLDVLYDSTEALSILLDVLLVAIATALMTKIHIAPRRRCQILGLFATRFLVVAVAIGHTISMRKTFAESDLTWTMVVPTIWAQALVTVSTITACIPGMKQALLGMSTGLTRMVIPDGLRSSSKSLGSKWDSKVASPFKLSRRKGESSAFGDHDEAVIWHHSAMMDEMDESCIDQVDREVEGSESTRGLRVDVIVQTKEVVVQAEPGGYEHFSDRSLFAEI